MSALRIRPGWKPDPDSPLPPLVQERHHSLCEACGACYMRRDRAIRARMLLEADDFEVIGDIYFAQARALLAEWGL